jgi:hypothetical protein
MADVDGRADRESPARGIDSLLLRYSRWKTRRLIAMDATPLSTLAVQNLYLAGCIIADGVFLPWAVTLLEGGFSFLLFALLLLPALVVESMGYRRLKAAPKRSG